ncbi:cellulose binding domain-containing protein [Kutzneria buriramensis]|uniref:Fibronectin type III domain protein n=1 Tax=Kutzneria buriramensis TaxID=1045776 RepID=A0A3E0GWJ4_9PSEU|nr:cellulose binding domain-containing protein [Kutzneria buriramensis]REH28447.1 fibronectin type III domain protein [Kutzneria buriramensis]
MFRRLTLPVAAALALAAITAVPVTAATPGAVSADFAQTSVWGGGYQGQYTIDNQSNHGITSWKVEFDLPAGTTVSSSWDATETVSGSHYTFTNKSYNGTVAAGATAAFGFVAAGSAAPTNCLLNGATCAGVVDKTPPSAPTNLKAGTITTTGVALSWSASTDNIGVTGYDVYKGSTKALTIAGTSATVTGLAPSTQYTFTVKAHDLAGNQSAASNAITVTTQAGSGSGSTWPLKVAPYVDMGSWPTPVLTDTSNASGLQNFTLAFITGNGCKATWFNAYDPTTGWDRDDIDALRAQGGDVTISFGGEAGTELAGSCTDQTAIQQQYQAIVTAYSASRIDFDIEGAAVVDHTAVDRRNAVLAKLQAANPGLQVSYTLPVMPYGLTSDGTYIVQSAANHGVNVSLVNVMAMDYGQGDGIDMGLKAQQAAQATHDQLKTIYPAKTDSQLWGMIGVTPMLGVNDDGTTFSLADASALVSYANGKHLGELAFWEVTRDRNACNGSLTNCTNVAQQPYDFSKRFEGFMG